MPKQTPLHKSRSNDTVKDTAIVTLRRIVDPLTDLMLDAGVTVHEFNFLLRDRAVRNAAKRVTKESGRDSKSRVAIVTGLPRSEVARILKTDEVSYNARWGQHSARKVLAAWFDNPRFLAANGEPAVLPIFGKRRSFEQLVAMHSGGIPVRAMLDELTQIQAVERLPEQQVKAKSRTPILTGLTSSAIAAIGERTRDLLRTLTNNIRCPSKPFFEGTAFVDENDLEIVSLVRREIQEQAANFITSANSLFKRSCVKPYRTNAKSSSKVRLGVTVYYFQDDKENLAGLDAKPAHRCRKNLRRQLRPKRTSSASAAKVHT